MMLITTVFGYMKMSRTGELGGLVTEKKVTTLATFKTKATLTNTSENALRRYYRTYK